MKETIEGLKIKLKWLPKDEKLNAIQQLITDRALAEIPIPKSGTPAIHPEKGGPSQIDEGISQNIDARIEKKKMKNKPSAILKPTNNELKKLKKEIENNFEAYESQTQRAELVPYMYDRDLNWYFNAKNIPAQKNLVAPTYEYFDKDAGKDFFSPIDFLNLLYNQYEGLRKNMDKPFDVLDNLKSIPLSDRERHILYGFIIKWFGGYPVNNLDEQCDTVLKLVEKEFLNYPDHTPEKEFCAVDVESSRKLANLAAHMAAEWEGVKVILPNEQNINPKYKFSESRYINKVSIDFEDLPGYVVQRGIIWKFESQRMNKDSEYYEWQDSLAKYLNSIPNEHRLNALRKGVEYGNKVYRYHLDNECTNRSTCILNESWERRISLAKDMLQRVEEKAEKKQEGEPPATNEKNKDFTTARQVLALHFIFEQLQIRSTEVDRTVKANFVEFLTGKNNKNIYDALENPFITKEKKFRFEDLKFVRNYFETLGLSEIVKAINNQLDKPR